jgi:hypothetical protein
MIERGGLMAKAAAWMQARVEGKAGEEARE